MTSLDTTKDVAIAFLSTSALLLTLTVAFVVPNVPMIAKWFTIAADVCLILVVIFCIRILWGIVRFTLETGSNELGATLEPIERVEHVITRRTAEKLVAATMAGLSLQDLQRSFKVQVILFVAALILLVIAILLTMPPFGNLILF